METTPLDIEDFAALRDYLLRSGRIAADERPQLVNLAGGVSNRTVLVHRPDGEAWVLKQALAKLRVKADWFSDPRRIEREAEGIRWLSRLAPVGTITPLVFFDPRQHLLAMAAVPQPHENWKTMLLRGQVQRPHVEQFGRLLGTIHRGGYEQREAVAAAFADRGFFESLRVEPYYLYSAKQVPAAEPFITSLVNDTRQRQITLVHGDYSPKNILVHDGRLVLLDHEVIHFGDPAFDLGFALTHLLSKAHHLPPHRPVLAGSARHFWQSYRAALGDAPWAQDLEVHAVRHALGCLLARVAGRSPLEYLSPPQQARQRDTAVRMMQRPPATVGRLVDEFLEGLEDWHGED